MANEIDTIQNPPVKQYTLEQFEVENRLRISSETTDDPPVPWLLRAMNFRSKLHRLDSKNSATSISSLKETREVL